ncbi:hypothetical protein FIBSPDRAFT_943958 [Athelia psychrophila]|uniref:BTB domain-containing protein n=1 Tax=Athelia psychrophila TaxID=1759441 RepID=A0A166VRM1_9AGAM|nr:hypothetical protein FIBSPDRAFT_943958 [Fibularhizoctonia sp. CBS 109695]
MSHSPDSHLHSPPRTPPKKNINMKGLSWLARSHSSNSNYNNNSSTSTTKIRISEPRFASVLEYTPARTGVLGSGAVVVKTPMEALAAQFRLEEEQRGLGPEREKDDLPASPVLPPVPFQTTPMQHQPQQQQHQQHKQTHASPRLPHFAPILLGPAPVAGADPARIIVALETGTATHRTTLATLSSRASHLALYLAALLPDADADDAYAQSPVFASIFHAHLAESGLLTQASSSVHVFLDRPSAPYEHIVAYLRTPPSTRAHPATLPRALHPSLMAPAARTAALLELRDEARWLALDELYILCAAELLGVAQEVCVPRESVASRYSEQTATPEEQDVLEEEEEERAQAHAQTQEEQMLVVVEVPEEDEEEADDFAPRAPAPDDAMASCRSRDTVAAIYATYSEPLTPLPPLPPFPAPKSASSSASTSASTPASTSKARSPPPPPPKISHAYSQSTAPSYAHSTAQQPVPAPSMRGSAPPATPLFAHFARGNGSGDEEQDDVVVVRPDAHAFGAGPPTPTPKSFSHPPAARPTHKISASVGMGVRAPVRGPPGPGWI